MKLPDHVDKIRNLIEAAFDKQFARLGIGKTKLLEIDRLPAEVRGKRERYESILENHIGETGDYEHAWEKLMDELTFTLFNRLAAVKVMEAAALFPPVLTKQPEHGDRSFGHKAWLERNEHMRSEELEGIREYLKTAFDELGETLPLYSKAYPYALLPDAISLNEIIDAFNAVEKDSQVDGDIWQSDDVIGWMYESYNNKKKQAHKDSGDKTEYNKVSLQSQVYTPRWVVQFLVENSLGKLYLEMYLDSEIKRRYKIANAPQTQERKPKPLHEVKVIDPACGSGNFLLYAFDFFYELYVDQIDNYGADYDEKDIPKLIIEKNLYGIDLDDRAVQLAQLGLFIKAKKKRRNIGDLAFNLVSSDFYLPEYDAVKEIFESQLETDIQGLGDEQKKLIRNIWDDLKYAYKFGSLIRIDEQVNAKLKDIEARAEGDLFGAADLEAHKDFAATFFTNLKTAVEQYAQAQGSTFLTTKTRDAITFLELLTTEYDVATANPPYTKNKDFGAQLKNFINTNYSKPNNFNKNLYACFIKRCYELTINNGYLALVHPDTFLFIKDYEDVRKFLIKKLYLNILAHYDSSAIFGIGVVFPALYVAQKNNKKHESAFIDLRNCKRNLSEEKKALELSMQNLCNNAPSFNLFHIRTEDFNAIAGLPFIYWISNELREKFKAKTFHEVLDIRAGIQTSNNDRFLRYWWEVGREHISFDSIVNNNKFWIPYAKGGPYKKWAGNLWLVINWYREGVFLQEYLKSRGQDLHAQKFYFKKGLTYSATNTKGISFRDLPKFNLFDIKGSCLFSKEDANLEFCLAVLNSKLTKYLIDCLNPTIETQVGDVKRIPFVDTKKELEQEISEIALNNTNINYSILKNEIVEFDYEGAFFLTDSNIGLQNQVKYFFNYENHLFTQVLLNEAIINEKIFEVYDLTEHDKTMVLAKEGESIGGLPITSEARNAYLAETEATKEFPLDAIREFIEALPTKEFTAEERETIENGFGSLYQNNNDLEEFCIRHQVNPINVWYWFKQSNVIPQQRMHTLAMEFLADMIREILMEDEDGIIPLVPNAGEKVLLDRIEEKFREKGFSSAQYSSFDSVLGRPIHEYLNKYFFAELSDHLNLFMYLPKTPFIWHLSSGPEQGFDCYIIIYKWSRDKLMRLRSSTSSTGNAHWSTARATFPATKAPMPRTKKTASSDSSKKLKPSKPRSMNYWP